VVCEPGEVTLPGIELDVLEVFFESQCHANGMALLATAGWNLQYCIPNKIRDSTSL
jgi:hypothetical protein